MWLSCLAENGKEAHWLFQPISRPLRRTDIKLLGYARLKTLVQKREGGGGKRKEDGKSPETQLLIQPDPSGFKEKEQESNSERHSKFHKYCFFGRRGVGP